MNHLRRRLAIALMPPGAAIIDEDALHNLLHQVDGDPEDDEQAAARVELSKRNAARQAMEMSDIVVPFTKHLMGVRKIMLDAGMGQELTDSAIINVWMGSVAGFGDDDE